MATLLIVDDEFKTRAAMTEVFSHEGHSVLPAGNAGEAQQVLANHPEIDVVFTDIGMPLGSGWDLLQHLREGHPDLPVVVVSAWGSTLDEAMILENGVRKVIGKPFTISELRVALREILHGPSHHS